VNHATETIAVEPETVTHRAYHGQLRYQTKWFARTQYWRGTAPQCLPRRAI